MSKSCTCILCGSPCEYTGLAYSENCSNANCKFAAVNIYDNLSEGTVIECMPGEPQQISCNWKLIQAGWRTNAPVRFVEKIDLDPCVRQLKEIAFSLFKNHYSDLGLTPADSVHLYECPALKDRTFFRGSEYTTVNSEDFVRADHVHPYDSPARGVLEASWLRSRSTFEHSMDNLLMSNEAVRELLNMPDPYEYVTLKARANNENT